MPLAVTSVLPVIRPIPGKCLTVEATPPARIPAMKAPTMGDTRSGLLENCRSKRPMGPLARPTEVGTVSATGARLTLMPALLVRGEQQAQPGRVPLRGEAGEVSGRRAHARDAAVPATEQDDPAEVTSGDERVEARA